MNHLLKAPFCVHPKTGRVCVPFSPGKVDRFSPDEVPTVLQLVEEIDAFAKEMSGEEHLKKVKDYKKTSLKESVGIFEVCGGIFECPFGRYRYCGLRAMTIRKPPWAFLRYVAWFLRPTRPFWEKCRFWCKDFMGGPRSRSPWAFLRYWWHFLRLTPFF
jgi:hypothetical protein